MTKIACRQLSPVLGDVAGNHRRIVAAIKDATAGGADIVIVPELATSGYVFHRAEKAASCAIAPGDPMLAEWSAALQRPDAVVIVGFAERADDGGLPYNSAAVVDSTGVRAVYRKAHLWDREKLFFRPGHSAPPVVDTAHGRVATMVCYDMEFPEYTRMVALAGADLIAVPTNWPLVERPDGERAPEVLIAQAAARVNRVFVACCDRAGVERGQAWNEETAIIDESGWLLAGPGGDADAEVDLLRARSKRLTEYADLHSDRRVDLYRLG